MVELCHLYSNSSSEVDLRGLLQYLTEAKLPYEPVSSYPLPKAYLSTATKQEIVSRYAAGQATAAIARDLSIGKSTVNRVLHQLGVEMRPRGRYW